MRRPRRQSVRLHAVRELGLSWGSLVLRLILSVWDASAHSCSIDPAYQDNRRILPFKAMHPGNLSSRPTPLPEVPRRQQRATFVSQLDACVLIPSVRLPRTMRHSQNSGRQFRMHFYDDNQRASCVPIRIARTQPSVAITWTGPTIRMTAAGAAAAQPMPGTGHTSMHRRLGGFFLYRSALRVPAEKIRPNGKQAQACHTPISFLGQTHSTRYNAGHLLDTAGYFSAAPFGPPRRIAFTNAQNSAPLHPPCCAVCYQHVPCSSCSSTLTAPPLTAAPMPWRIREHWGSTWSAKRPREQDESEHSEHASVCTNHSFLQPTAKPTPARAPWLVPTHSMFQLALASACVSERHYLLPGTSIQLSAPPNTGHRGKSQRASVAASTPTKCQQHTALRKNRACVSAWGT